jgi:hypothetical protein
MRARTRHAIHHDPEGLMPTEREISDPWNMDKDGKQWIDPEKWPEAMRK